jgi:hypothetical protein
LDQARQEFNAGQHNSRKRLEVAQYQLDLAKKQVKHEDKASKSLVKDHPHLPVIKATEKSSNAVVDAIDELQIGTILTIRENTDRILQQQASLHVEFMELMRVSIHETRELRIVSYSLDFRWRFFS